ncbi:hypothetical protein [Aquimarina sp. SS2-1]|uniref:hypothetical protein n=1 Tax=Aquimarina besae TaxID=3342247 RepID=UPI00366FF440
MKKVNVLTVFIFTISTLLFTSCGNDDDGPSCPIGTVELPASAVKTYNGTFTGLIIGEPEEGTATITRTACGTYSVSFSIADLPTYTDITFISDSDGVNFNNLRTSPNVTINEIGLTVASLDPIFTFSTEDGN